MDYSVATGSAKESDLSGGIPRNWMEMLQVPQLAVIVRLALTVKCELSTGSYDRP